MTLEDLIFDRLISRQTLIDKLAKFGAMPAVFYLAAPSDQANGWQDRRQTPRIDYSLDRQANPERHSSGTVVINIWCNETEIPPEEIEPDVKNALCDVFMQPDAEQMPYCLVWARSDAFESPRTTTNNNYIKGITIQFDALAFPNQLTTSPDPVRAINNYVRTILPEATIIGSDILPNYYIPSATEPAFYFRILSLETARITNAVAWLNVAIAGHIYAPTTASRIRWMKAFTDELVLHSEALMEDGSPMVITNIRADSTADHLTTGQLRITAQYGVLRRQPEAQKLMHPHIQTQIGG